MTPIAETTAAIRLEVARLERVAFGRGVVVGLTLGLVGFGILDVAGVL